MFAANSGNKQTGHHHEPSTYNQRSPAVNVPVAVQLLLFRHPDHESTWRHTCSLFPPGIASRREDEAGTVHRSGALLTIRQAALKFL